ncbi:MAG: sulfotransferase domain-containing protein [Pseudomonadota bacterium]
MNKFVFALHRGGSSVLGGITKNCALASGEAPVMLGAGKQAFHETGPEGAAVKLNSADEAAAVAANDYPEPEFAPQLANWQQYSGVFAPIRRADFFPTAFFKDGDRAILNMRDPRDCMVSGYYGFLRLHGSGLADEARREQYERGIDDYVINTMLNRYIKATRNYMALIERIPNVKVLLYEDMVTKFDRWFSEYYKYLGFKEDRFDDVCQRQAVKFQVPEAEDIDSHKRQMLPGDHLRKLSSQTVDTINKKMERELAFFGYL